MVTKLTIPATTGNTTANNGFGSTPEQKKAILFAETSILNMYKDYTAKGGYMETETKLQNLGFKLREHLHGIAKEAVALATVIRNDKPICSLPMAQEFFGELCKRAEQKLLGQVMLANKEPAKNVRELMPVWPTYKTQVSQFFTGEGKEAGDTSSNNPADYKEAGQFVAELRKRRIGRAARPNDGAVSPVSGTVLKAMEGLHAAILKVVTDGKLTHEAQDQIIVPILVGAAMEIADTIEELEEDATSQDGEEEQDERPANRRREVDAPQRRANG